MSSSNRFSFARLSFITIFCAASGLAAIACGGDDAATTTTGAGGTAGSAGAGGAGGAATGGGGAGGSTGGSAGTSATGGSSGAGGGTGGAPGDGGVAGSGGAGGGDGGVAMTKKKQAFAIVSAGNMSKSANYTLISTMGQGPAMNGSSKSTNYRLNAGVVGATQ